MYDEIRISHALLRQFPKFDDLPLNSDYPEVERALRPVAEGRLAPNLLLIGQNGAGKTTLARLLRCWYAESNGYEHYMVRLLFQCAVTEFNIKALIKHTCYATHDREWIIIDEVDKIDFKKQQQLLNVIGSAPATSFILTGNDAAKIYDGLKTRCETVFVHPPKAEEFLPYAQRQLHAAGKQLPDDLVLGKLKTRSTAAAMSQVLERLLA